MEQKPSSSSFIATHFLLRNRTPIYLPLLPPKVQNHQQTKWIDGVLFCRCRLVQKCLREPSILPFDSQLLGYPFVRAPLFSIYFIPRSSSVSTPSADDILSRAILPLVSNLVCLGKKKKNDCRVLCRCVPADLGNCVAPMSSVYPCRFMVMLSRLCVYASNRSAIMQLSGKSSSLS